MEIYNLSGKDPLVLKDEIKSHFGGREVFTWETTLEDGSLQVSGVPLHQLLEFLQNHATRICRLIDSYSSVRISPPRADRAEITVIIKTTQPSLFIGWHGKTLDAIEHILTVILSNALRTAVSVKVDTAQYRKKREDFLRALVKKVVREIELDHRERPIRNLLPRERRLIHMMFADHPYLTTESRGEGENRTLFIVPRPPIIDDSKREGSQ